VHGCRGVQPDPGMAVLVVVVGEEDVAERACFVQGGEAPGEDRAVLEGLEGGFGIGIRETLIDPGSKGISSVAFTSQSHYAAAADANGHVYIWTVATGRLSGIVTDHGSTGVRGVAYSPDGQSIPLRTPMATSTSGPKPNYRLTATLTSLLAH
jgi:WD40 repeat protein